MTHGDCASAGQCRLDGVEKSNGAVGVTAEYKLTFFFSPFPVEEFTHRWVFCVDLNDADYGGGGGCIFAHNI